MYKEASKQKLRINTPKGLLSIEQLWDLTLPELDIVAILLKDEYKESGKKSFLVKKSSKDKVLKLKFDIVVDILTTKVEDASASLTAQETKVHNQQILQLIADKENTELANKSVDELKKLLK